MKRPKPRCFKGFRDVFAQDLLRKQRLVEAVRRVYEGYGFLPLETPAIEYVDVLGKFLPESVTPEGGIFSFRNPDLGDIAAKDDPDLWLALRYDLTAPLARVAAQYPEIPRPFRRYQVGSVFRYEKPGPGRFREFTQLDFDSVGVPDVSADAEACCVIADAIRAMGFAQDEFIVKVNNRKVMQGVLEVCGIDSDIASEQAQGTAVLRAMDKLDRLGMDGVVQLLGAGRKDKSGDETAGAELSPEQIAKVEAFLRTTVATRAATCSELEKVVGGSAIGSEGVAELARMDRYLDALGYGSDVVTFDPTIIRGLSYYTGPVFEGVLTKEIKDEKGRAREFGSIFGGGRYDDLVERFTGQKVPATGASAGVDRLLDAMKLLPGEEVPSATSDVIVTVMDRERMADYLRMAQEIRSAGIRVEVFLGSGRIGKQLKYADRLGIRLAVIAGGDEFAAGTCEIKDLELGRKIAEGASLEEWRDRPQQRTVPAAELVQSLRDTLASS